MNINKPNNKKELSELPKLKSTIEIIFVGTDLWKDKVWALEDKLLNKYYYLGRLEYEIISRWYLRDPGKIICAINNETIFTVNYDTIDRILKFLLYNNLLQVGREVLSKFSSGKSTNKSISILINNIVKNLSKIFFHKVKLIEPDVFLNNTRYISKILFSKKLLYLIISLLFINFYLLASNWSAFKSNIPDLTSTSSIIYILFTLVFTKVIHELGHAYACKLYNCRVSDMGISFIFFYPLFYTNVSNSILLPSDKRLLISLAGLISEFYLAVIAGFLWFFVSDNNIVKSLLFYVASVSWLISLMINLMPFMKFDGYYILSDYLNIRNLAPRASNVFKYYFRQKVFGIKSEQPEQYDKAKYRFLLYFAIFKGIYRVTVFASIFLFLYYIKIIGVLLLSLAILSLVLLPIIKEFRNIYLLRNKVASYKNIIISLCCTILIISFLFVPLNNNIYIPAVFQAKVQRVYAPFAAKVDSINIDYNKIYNNKNYYVKKDQDLLVLSNIDILSKLEISKIHKQTSENIVKESKISTEKRKDLITKLSDIDFNKIIEQNLLAKQNQLIIKAPISGQITAIYNNLHANTWIESNGWLLDIVDYSDTNIQGFVSIKIKDKVNNTKLINNNNIIFIPDDINLPGCNTKFISMAPDPIDKLNNNNVLDVKLSNNKMILSKFLLFASQYGGSINFEKDEQGNLIPIDSYFNIEFASIDCKYYTNTNKHIIKGVIKISGPKMSLAARFIDIIKNNMFI